jgi:hypothetical protein
VNKLKSVIGPLFVFSLAFLVGIALSTNSSEKYFFKRDPATANSKVFQLDQLTNEEMKLHLRGKIKVHPTAEGIKNISFNGFSSAVCKSYPTVEVEFAAEGVLVAGESPRLVVTQPCEAGQELAEMASLRMPIGKLLTEKPRNAEFKYEGFTAVIKTYNSADEWPRQWILKRVEFKPADNNLNTKQVEFSREPASVAEEPPIVIEF